MSALPPKADIADEHGKGPAGHSQRPFRSSQEPRAPAAMQNAMANRSISPLVGIGMFSDFHKDCSDQSLTPLTGLSAGSYHFRILASERSGAMLEGSRTLAITSAQDEHHA
jgi:hypothetical protein